HLSVKDGLSNSSVNCILQDRDGYMWFGTNEGLNKYDGYTFTVFQPDPDQPTRSFHNGHITGMCEGISDELWVITEGGGLHEVNRKTGLVTPHPIKAPKANRWNNQISAYKDSQNIIWITTFAGLASYEPKRHLFTLYPAPNPEWPVKTVFEDRQHRFWVATHQGLYLFDRPTGRFTPVLAQVGSGPQPSFMSFYLDNEDVLWIGTASAGHSLFQLNLRQQPWKLVPYNPGGQLNPYVWRNTMHRDAMGIIWVGTTNGLQGIDPITAKVYTYRPDPVSSKSISSNNAQAVYHDRTGMLWIGTDNGIDRQAVNTKPFETYRVVPNERMASIDENRVNALLKDNRGRLWFSNFATVYRTSANNKQLEIIPPGSLGSTAENKNFTYCFFNDGSDDVWLGTNSGLYRFDQLSGEYKKYPTEFFIQFIDRAPNGELWVGGEGGIASFNEVTHKYTYYTYKEGDTTRLIDKYVHGVLASRTGDVWVLIKQMGVCRLNPKTGRFTRYTDGPKGHLSSNDVQSIYEDKEGVIWIGTHLGGLNRFDPKTGLFSVITHQDGIPGNSVLAITSDESGHIWLSTDDGLCRVDPKTKAIHRYELTDGLPSNIFLPNAVFRQPNQLFFGSTNGIVYFNPDRIRDNTRPFPVYINELTVLDKPRAITDSIIRLNHDENMLSFGFAALAYEQPDQNQFDYQLVGVNKDW
ncbi:MAG TPA: two-component regulator propeller domain-containing protein, partial [Fibrella sp.]